MTTMPLTLRCFADGYFFFKAIGFIFVGFEHLQLAFLPVEKDDNRLLG